MALPNFLIIGAAKSGTTSLYNYAHQHPDVFMSERKEPQFFALDGKRPTYQGPADERGVNSSAIYQLEEYERLFEEGRHSQIRGEGSPWYMFHPKAPKNIRSMIPDAKIVAILRNPIDRAYADYVFARLRGADPAPTFSDAIDAEDERRLAGWSLHTRYIEKGFYYRHISRYLEYFPAQQLKILLYDDLRDDPDSVMEELFAFLGVDPSIRVDTALRFSVSGTPRSQLAQGVVNRLRSSQLLKNHVDRRKLKRAYTSVQRRNIRRADPMPPAVRDRLAKVYARDGRLLEGLLARDLSAWFNSSTAVDGSSNGGEG